MGIWSFWCPKGCGKCVTYNKRVIEENGESYGIYFCNRCYTFFKEKELYEMNPVLLRRKNDRLKKMVEL